MVTPNKAGHIGWTYLDGLNSHRWKLYLYGDRLTVTTNGSVGVGTTTPGHAAGFCSEGIIGTSPRLKATSASEIQLIV